MEVATELRIITGRPVRVRPSPFARARAARWTISASPTPVRVLIVDSATCFRRAARELLERRGYVIAGEADSVATAVTAAKRLVPDAVLLDLHLSDGSGLDVCAALRRALFAPAVLLTSVFDLPERDRLVKHTGAAGFVPKARLGSIDFVQFWPSPRGAQR
jgi:DNA-binding NarL/FixJ family response regulator